MNKFVIIGGGNMGGAVARGLSASGYTAQLVVVDINPDVCLELNQLGIKTSTNAGNAVVDADYVLVAVKPWLVDTVMEQIAATLKSQKTVLASLAAGISIASLKAHVGEDFPLLRLIPNTAVTVGESMTFISSSKVSENQITEFQEIFSELGKIMLIKEDLMPAATALASCGIAYALRYLRAASEAGVEIGFTAVQAHEIVAQTMLGAAELILQNESHPEVEIDKVTTAKGITIKGLNAMEEAGFSAAVMAGVFASHQS